MANERIAKLVWRKVDSQGTIQAYRKYRKTYPNSPLAQIAYNKEQGLAWTATEKQNTLESYLEFAKTYKETSLGEVAHQMAHRMAWQRAQEQDSVGQYAWFLTSFPASPWAAEALRREIALIWDKTRSADNWGLYRAFSAQFPHTPQAAKAAEMGFLQWAFAGPIGADELTTRTVLSDTRISDNIRLYVQVLDEKAKIVGGLGTDNFSVFDGPCQAEIVGFQGMETTRPVDIVFVLDTTGSMRSQIQGVKNAAIQFAENLRLRNMDVKLGLVTFGDKIRGVYPSGSGLTSDIRKFQSWVAKQDAVGGADKPENAIGALAKGAGKKFRKDAHVLIILISDAPYHQANRHTKLTTRTAAERVTKKGAMLFSLAPSNYGYEGLMALAGGTHWNLDRYPDFSNIILDISLLTSRTYRLSYKPTGCLASTETDKVRVRARHDHIWVPMMKGALPKSIVSLLPAEPNNLLASVANGGIYRSTDAALTWSPAGPESSRGATFELGCGDDPKNILAICEKGDSLLSADGGAAWKEGLKTIAAHSLNYPSSNSDKLLLLDNDKIFGSEDAGQTWPLSSKVPPGVHQVLADFISSKRLLALGQSSAWLSSNDGESWDQHELALPPTTTEGARYELFHHPHWPSLLFAISTDGGLYRTMDGARSWRKVNPRITKGDTHSEVAVRNLIFDHSQRHWIFLETDSGVWSSNTNGREWFTISGGISEEDSKNPVLGLGRTGEVWLGGRETGNIYQLFPMENREFISGNVYFEFGSAELLPALKSYLNNVAEGLIRGGAARVQVEGHTDDIGSNEDNLALSLLRAENVRDYIVSRGIKESLATAVGLGESRPVFPNNSDRNRAQNRRVEFTVLLPPSTLQPYKPQPFKNLSTIFAAASGSRAAMTEVVAAPPEIALSLPTALLGEKVKKQERNDVYCCRHVKSFLHAGTCQQKWDTFSPHLV